MGNMFKIVTIILALATPSSMQFESMWTKQTALVVAYQDSNYIVARDWCQKSTVFIDSNTGVTLATDEEGEVYSAVVDDGAIYYITHSSLKKFDVETKTIGTMFNIPKSKRHSVSSLVKYNNMLVFSTEVCLFVVSRETGLLINEIQTNLFPMFSYANKLFCIDGYDEIGMFDCDKQSFSWTKSVSSGNDELLNYHSQPFFIKDSFLYYIINGSCHINKSHLVCASQEDGEVVWDMELNGYFYLKEFIGDDLYLVTTNKILRLSLTDKTTTEIVSLSWDVLPRYIYAHKFLVYGTEGTICFMDILNPSNIKGLNRECNDYHIYEDNLILENDCSIEMYKISEK